MDGLVREAVFGDAETKPAARWIIGEAARPGHPSASIHDLYQAEGRESFPPVHRAGHQSPPLSYDAARAVFRAAPQIDAGAFILKSPEARIGYSEQRPGEYAATIQAAAIREGFRGPLFLQCDHFQISAKKYAAAPDSS